jgi:hypothetical protein
MGFSTAFVIAGETTNGPGSDDLWRDLAARRANAEFLDIEDNHFL